MNCFTPRKYAAGWSALVAVAGVSTGVANAADAEYAIEAGVARSDNVLRSASDEVGETIATAGAYLSLDNKTRRTDLNLLGDFAYNKYLNNSYDSDVVGGLEGSLRLAIVPQRFDWIIDDNFGMVRTNQFLPETPTNRESINYLSTGPDFTLQFGQRTYLRVNGRYSNVAYEISPFDEDRYRGGIELERLLTSSSSFALNGEVEKVEFTQLPEENNYRREEYYLRYNVDSPRINFRLDVGHTNLVHTDSENGGTLARLFLSRKISASSTLRFELGREFSSTGATLKDLQSFNGVGGAAEPIQAAPSEFLNTYGILGWNFARNRTAVDLSAVVRKERFDQTPELDRQTASIRFDASRQLSPAMSAYILGGYFKVSFELPGQDYSESQTGVGLLYGLASRLSLDLRYDRFHRSADVASTEYTENQYWLMLSYGTGASKFRRR